MLPSSPAPRLQSGADIELGLRVGGIFSQRESSVNRARGSVRIWPGCLQAENKGSYGCVVVCGVCVAHVCLVCASVCVSICMCYMEGT